MQIETATRFANGKRNRDVFKATLQADLKAVITSLVESTLETEEIAEVFFNSGVILPSVTLQDIIAKRYVSQGATKGIAAGGR
jgi:hypothetical protein